MDVLVLVDSSRNDAERIETILNSLRSLNFTTEDNVLYLGFVDDTELKIVQHLRETIPPSRLQILNPSELMDHHAIEFRERARKRSYDFFERWGALCAKTGNHSMSEKWWYTDNSEKNSLVDECWWLWFHCFIAMNLCVKRRPGKIIFVGEPAQGKVLSEYCKKSKIELEEAYFGRLKGMPRKTLFWLSRRLYVFFSLCLTMVMAKIFCLFAGNKAPKPRGVNFYSWYPRSWTEWKGALSDFYLGRVMQLVGRAGDEVHTILRIYDNKRGVSLPDLLSRARRLRHDWRMVRGPVLFENFIGWLDLFGCFLDFRDIFRSRSLINSEEGRQLFLDEETDLSPLFAPLLWASILISWPFAVLTEKTARAIAAKTDPRLTVLYSFEYIHGKAIIKGTHSVQSSDVVGIQHGPFAPMKFTSCGVKEELNPPDKQLSPMPVPDKVIVDGASAKQLWVERGISEEAVEVCGPPRFDGLWPDRPFRTDRTNGSEICVLVAPGLHDAALVISHALRSLTLSGSKENVSLIIKPHPKTSLPKVRALMGTSAFGNKKIRLVDKGGIYEWFCKADMIMTTYSSAGVEALAFGLPVMMIKSSWMPDMSLFFNCKQDVVMCLREPEDFVKSIERFTEFKACMNRSLEEFFVHHFGFPDNRASERVAASIERSSS